MTQNILQLPYTSAQILQMMSNLNNIDQKVDGNWVVKTAVLWESDNPELKDHVFDLSSYLPDDSNDYMILGFIAAKNSNIEIFSGKLGYVHEWSETPSSITVTGAQQFIIALPSRQMTVKLHKGTAVRLYLSGYKKLGTGFNS